MDLYEPCVNLVNVAKCWPYSQYYLGEKDEEKRRNGEGINHWTGAESLENYEGDFLRDTMHGYGTYRWKHEGPYDVFATYEGHFYGNKLHGYGVMSYQNGNVFTGIFYRNIRWGPGVESQPCLREDVGLWRGTQLVRLSWMPAAPNVALNLGYGNGKSTIEPFRILLATNKKTIGEVNSAIELMKHCGSKPMVASEMWSKLYPANCNDLSSQLCNVQVFQRGYYNKNISFLEETDVIPELIETDPKDNQNINEDSDDLNEIYYAWNNNKMMIQMMKHCFTHEKQRVDMNFDIQQILIGPRSLYKPPGKHEIDCRTLLMACYLGHIKNVAQLVNENNVNPNVADNQGNTAIMYAACGNQPQIIHFLHEAGGHIDNLNDCCCTPLGLALLRFVCTCKNITPMNMVQALLPPPPPVIVPDTTTQILIMPLEWNIVRELPEQLQYGPALPTNKAAAKAAPISKKIKSTDDFGNKKKTSNIKMSTIKEEDQTFNTSDPFYEEKRLYYNINAEYLIRVNELFSIPSEVNPIPYLFEVDDMVKYLFNEEELKKRPEKTSKSKMLKDKEAIKGSKSAVWRSSPEFSRFSVDKTKAIALSAILTTITQLLNDGANPRLVRCPQPALFMAVMSGNTELVQLLASHGADVNEVYPTALGYTALDVAVSMPLSEENLEIVITLLENGARTDHLLRYVDPANPEKVLPGPTLLHAVLAKHCENFSVEELQKQLLEYLLKYGCNPLVIFNGRSAIDLAMDKSIELFEIVMNCPTTNLNAVINSANQTILVKMFTIQYLKNFTPALLLQTITSLLLYGADPFLECSNETEVYQNLFAFIKKQLAELNAATKVPVAAGKTDPKSKKTEKPKSSEAKAFPSKTGHDGNLGDFKQELDFLVECSRTLLVRRLQGKLFKELLDVVKKYKHRQWNMILPEHKTKKPCSLWLTGARCLEIWNIMKTNKRNQNLDKRVLKQMLCIVEFYLKRVSSFGKFKDKVKIEEKNAVELTVCRMLHEYKVVDNSLDEIDWTRPYVMPELSLSKDDQKYDVCFECLQKNEEDPTQKIVCFWCKLVWFCSFECMRVNIDRVDCHPCSYFLKGKYYPTPSGSVTTTTNVTDIV